VKQSLSEIALVEFSANASSQPFHCEEDVERICRDVVCYVYIYDLLQTSLLL
jgi:hypothetical protein